MPVLMFVMRSREVCRMLRVSCRWVLTDFIDWIAREGSACANKLFFSACHCA